MIVAGELRQLGSPAELIAAPADAFVAAFTGAKCCAGPPRRRPGAATEVALEIGARVRSTDALEGDVDVVVHPWQVSLAADGDPPDPALNEIRAPVRSLTPLGGRTRVLVGPLTAEVADAGALAPGALARARFAPADTRLIARG